MRNSNGAVPSVSSNGSTGGIMWAVESTNKKNPTSCPGTQDEPGTDYENIALHAYDATNISIELYNGRGQNPNTPAGYTRKFHTPTISNGKFFVSAISDTTATLGMVDVYGLCSDTANGQCLH
jgi:hypothetical protein